MIGSLGVDKAKTREEFFSEALAKMDSKDCKGAIESFKSISEGEMNDDIRNAHGWAYLCIAGASLNKVIGNLLGYDKSKGDLSIFGTLANGLIPMDGDKIGEINNSINTFGKISNADVRRVNVAFAYILKAAALIAKQSVNNAPVKRTHISGTGCAADKDICATSTNCDAGGNGNMTSADANSFGDTVLDGQASVGGIAKGGKLKDLADKLGETLSADVTDAAAEINRCVIYNKVLTE